MKKLYILILSLTITSVSFGQVINEIDADTPETDTAEFIEIKHTPNTALDGHVVVLFNGDGDVSYADVTPTTLSKNTFTESIFKMYPNPAKSGFVNITSTKAGAVQAQVFNVLGKQVLNGLVANERLDVSSLNTGVYIVKLTQDSATSTKKLIIQ